MTVSGDILFFSFIILGAFFTLLTFRMKVFAIAVLGSLFWAIVGIDRMMIATTDINRWIAVFFFILAFVTLFIPVMLREKVKEKPKKTDIEEMQEEQEEFQKQLNAYRGLRRH